MKYLSRIALMALILSPLTVVAQEDQNPAEKFAGSINYANEMVERLKTDLARITDEAKAHQKDGNVPEEAVNGDLAEAKTYYDTIVADFEGAAKAWAKGDEAEAKRLQEAGNAGLRKKDIFQQRMFEFRRGQMNAAPSDEWYKEQSANVRTGAQPAFQNLVEKKKAASEAWGDVAKAAVPGVSQKDLNEAREKAFTAVGEAEVALMQYNWANQLEGMLESDKSVTKEDLKEPLAKLTKQQEELYAIRRKQIENERAMREGFAAISKANEELNKAFYTTREAKARAAAAAEAGK